MKTIHRKAKKVKHKNNKKEIVVFGCGKFGHQIVENLAILPEYRIIAVDTDQRKLKTLHLNVDSLIVGDSSNEHFLDELGIEDVGIFVIGIGLNIQASLLTAALLRKKYRNARVIAKAISDEHEAILRQLGVVELINPEKAGANRALIKIFNPILDSGKSEKINSIQEIEGGMSLVKVVLPMDLVGKKVKETGFPKEITIVLVYRKSKPLVVYGDFKFELGDEILIVADNATVIQFIDALVKR